MPNYILIFILGLLPLFSYAQHALHEAMELRKFLTFSSSPEQKIGNFSNHVDTTSIILPILTHYFPLKNADATLGDQFHLNPFIGRGSQNPLIHLPTNFLNEILVDDISKGPELPASKGLSVTNYLDGLSRFLAQRTKEELTLAFFNRFKTSIEKNKTLESLFPATREQLEIIDKEIYFYQTYIEALRESFIVDLKGLPHQLRLYFQDTEIIKSPYHQIIAEDLLESAQCILDKNTLTSWFEYMAYNASIQDEIRRGILSAENDQKTLQDIAATFKVINIISESLRQPNQDSSVRTAWIDPKEIRVALNDPKVLYLYLGLLWQKADGIVFSNGKSFRDGLNKFADTSVPVQKIGNFIKQWVISGKEVEATSDFYNLATVKDSLADNQALAYIQSFFYLAESALELQQELFEPNEIHHEEVKKLVSAIKHFNQLIYNIRTNHYVYAIHSLSGVLLEFLGPNSDKSKILRYTNFMASVAEARNGQEVAHALETFALPPGSSAHKKHSSFSVSVNAYTGFSLGKETLIAENKTLPTRTVTLFSAPVGLDLNFGMGKGGSLSFFAPIVDVGALTAYRLKDPDSSDLPELKWDNVFSPGLYMVYGLPWDLPIGLGLGFQQGPNFRKFQPNGQLDLVEAKGLRIGAFLSVDIPIVYLFTR